MVSLWHMFEEFCAPGNSISTGLLPALERVIAAPAVLSTGSGLWRERKTRAPVGTWKEGAGRCRKLWGVESSHGGREFCVRSLETVGADWECGGGDQGQAVPREGWAAPSTTWALCRYRGSPIALRIHSTVRGTRAGFQSLLTLAQVLLCSVQREQLCSAAPGEMREFSHFHPRPP